MISTHQIAQCQASLYSAQCYNLASRNLFRDSQISQLWGRWALIMKGAAVHYNEKWIEEDRIQAMVEDWELTNSWENMPCSNEA